MLTVLNWNWCLVVYKFKEPSYIPVPDLVVSNGEKKDGSRFLFLSRLFAFCSREFSLFLLTGGISKIWRQVAKTLSLSALTKFEFHFSPRYQDFCQFRLSRFWRVPHLLDVIADQLISDIFITQMSALHISGSTTGREKDWCGDFQNSGEKFLHNFDLHGKAINFVWQWITNTHKA